MGRLYPSYNRLDLGPIVGCAEQTSDTYLGTIPVVWEHGPVPADIATFQDLLQAFVF